MKYSEFIIIAIFTCLTSFSFGQAVEGALLGTWSDSTLVASNAHDNTYNEVWGLEVNDREFAVIGSTYGTHIIDVTDPTSPEELFVVKGGSIGAGIIHRDFHDYKGYLYSIADEGSNTGLQIIDITSLPDSIEVVYDSREYFTRSHNIFIDTAKAKLYSLISDGTSFGFSPMRIFDISNPIDPQPIGSYDRFGTKMVSQVHDAFVRNDTAYLNLGPNGFAIVNFENLDTPNVISILEPSEYPQPGYNHSGWLTDDGNYYYMADETYDSDIKALDLRDLPDISIPNTFNAEATESSITHNQIIFGNKLYVSYYVDGLQVFDITDPENPVREMYYDTSTEAPGPNRYRGAWGVYPFLSSGNILVSDMQNGLFVVDGDLPVVDVDEQQLENEVIVYPNPSLGLFNIDLQVFEGQTIQIDILDVNGRLIKSKETNKSIVTFDISNESNGIYSILISTDNTTTSKKLVLLK
jgi:choice-of-anchor B domain-containing protein